jgi:hypothetical protein
MSKSTATKVLVKAPTQTPVPDTISIPDIERQVAPFKLIGLSEIIVNNFSDKSKKQMEDASTGLVVGSKRGGKNKPPRDPEAEFQSARLLDAQGRDCVEARWVKSMLVTAAGMPDVNLDKKVVQRTVFVQGDLLPLELGEAVHMRTDWVRRGPWSNKVAMQCYRPGYRKWGLSMNVEFEPKLIPHAWLVYLVRRAGLSVGLCDWRVEKNGDFGRFDIRLAPVQ